MAFIIFGRPPYSYACILTSEALVSQCGAKPTNPFFFYQLSVDASDPPANQFAYTLTWFLLANFLFFPAIVTGRFPKKKNLFFPASGAFPAPAPAPAPVLPTHRHRHTHTTRHQPPTQQPRLSTRTASHPSSRLKQSPMTCTLGNASQLLFEGVVDVEMESFWKRWWCSSEAVVGKKREKKALHDSEPFLHQARYLHGPPQPVC